MTKIGYLQGRINTQFLSIPRKEHFQYKISHREVAITIVGIVWLYRSLNTNIIQVFKKHMLPKLEGDVGTSRTFVTPDVFEIEYHWIGGKGANAYLNKISTCVLQNLSVKYGGGRFSAHTPTNRGPDNLVGSTPPVESEISLSFKELEIITQNNVGRGF